MSFRLDILRKMEDSNNSNPAVYWKLFNELKIKSGGSSHSITGDEWLRHFTGSLNQQHPLLDENFVDEVGKLVEEHGDRVGNELDFSIKEGEISRAIKS